MAEVLIESEPAPGIVRLTLNRPAMRNALDEALIGALAAAIARHGERAATRVLLLAAAGSAFCAGADLASMRALGRANMAENAADARRLADLLAALHRCPKPSIACVQGAAFGGGIGLVAACDIAIASADARLRMPEVRLGLVPAVISPYLLEAIGPRQARRYALSGETIDAERARQIGLVHEVVAPDALAAAALALAIEVASGGQAALAATKDLLAEVGRLGPGEAAAARTAQILASVRAGTEAQEGLTAAIERRPPAWGR
ncbi:MAG TPA: enoyl-CoA hydratase-related protein [Steroidobacteraceae bacterium]|nr:enoyl-CoA hydratase-related protein [Steroidobacteraceae bacterium]